MEEPKLGTILNRDWCAYLYMQCYVIGREEENNQSIQR